MKNKTTKSKTTNTNNVIQTKAESNNVTQTQAESNTNNVIQTQAEFNETVKTLNSVAKSADVTKMTDAEIYDWIVNAETSVPKLIETIKAVKEKVLAEEGKLMKSTIGVVTGKFAKSKINFRKLRKVAKEQMKRVRNIKAISPIVSAYIEDTSNNVVQTQPTNTKIKK